MYQSRTTLTEISKALNLSVSTISKSLSNSSEISESTKERVHEFAKKCNYTPNNFAANFRRGYTKTIGLIIPNILNPFYANVLIGIEEYLNEKGYKLITSISNNSIEKEVQCLEKMVSGYVDGLIMCASKETELSNDYKHIKDVLNKNLPFVMFDRICEDINCDMVITDDYKAAYETTQHLINTKGCKNIVLVTTINNLKHGKLRAMGFYNAIKSYKNKINHYVIEAPDLETVKNRLSFLLKTNPSIDGIFCFNEQTVLEALHLTNNLNSKLNPNIPIAGFCNEFLAQYNPSLIVVNQNAKEIGIEAARLSLNRIESKAEKIDPETINVNFKQQQ